jgi:hypothetical protein
MFGVSAQTLRDRISGAVGHDNCRTGPSTSLSHEQKEVNHVETIAELGYGHSNNKLKHLAGEMAYESTHPANQQQLVVWVLEKMEGTALEHKA